MSQGLIGQIAIITAFYSVLAAMVGYALYSRASNKKLLIASNVLFGLQAVSILVASGILIHLLVTHQFGYYYVYNHTSTNLELRYLISAFWGGQEGSFLLWILLSAILGLGLMRWVHEPYKGPVLFFLSINQLLLLSMVLGVHIGDLTIGASPFRSVAEAFPNAPFLRANPDFVPAEGKGLNDLLKSPWMVIHPPALFLGFTMMGVPFYFAAAALWKRKYHEWVNDAMPWAIAGNLSLFIAIFLGGYWAYVTLSFGGYWAWDPVENASILPWIVGVAGIHFMLIQKSNTTALKSALFFAILAYAAVIYESFLTRSGVLGDASVHSFTDLGLYNQLLIFIVVILGSGLSLMAYRWKDLPSKEKPLHYLNRETWILLGGFTLFLLAFVIAIGTSSPILGRLFTENPTPPEISFYNEWSLPLATILAVLTVFGQLFFWKKQDAQSLINELFFPVSAAAFLSLVFVFIADMRDFSYILFQFSAWFAVFGNGVILYRMIRSNAMLIGGTLSHVGFGLLLLGILASSAYQDHLLDATTRQYNQAIAEGKVVDENGFPLQEPIQFVELKKNQPKLVNDRYLLTYLSYDYTNQSRAGQHAYKIRVEEVKDAETLETKGAPSYLYPEVYPMSTGTTLNWSVDVDVLSGLKKDVYLYVAGSSYVEERNRAYERQKNGNPHSVQNSAQDSKTEWVLLIAEEKPFVSIVWLGTFLLMIGSSFSIFRYWSRIRSSLTGRG